MSENYTILSAKVKRANTLAELRRLEKSCMLLYTWGQLTPCEYGRLDDMIMYRLARLD